MQIYYSNLQAIEQQTMQLDKASCVHCKQSHQLVSHGYIYQKQRCAKPEAIGKRVFCSTRHQHTGCGRTMRLYLDTTLRYLHVAGAHVVAFVLAFVAGVKVQQAYCQATGTADPRNAYRWLDRLCAQQSTYRSWSHQPALLSIELDIAEGVTAHHPVRRTLLGSTFRGLLERFGQSLCARYQQHTQCAFL